MKMWWRDVSRNAPQNGVLPSLLSMVSSVTNSHTGTVSSLCSKIQYCQHKRARLEPYKSNPHHHGLLLWDSAALSFEMRLDSTPHPKHTCPPSEMPCRPHGIIIQDKKKWYHEGFRSVILSSLHTCHSPYCPHHQILIQAWMDCGGQAATFRRTVFTRFCSFRRAHNLSPLKSTRK